MVLCCTLLYDCLHNLNGFVALCDGRFNGVEFMLEMKGKTVMFVGDSLGRNQWQSLICMLSSAVPQAQTQLLRGDPLSTFRFLVSI